MLVISGIAIWRLYSRATRQDEIVKVRASAMGSASHNPLTPITLGSRRIPRMMKTKVRRKAMKAEVFPLDRAVNMALEYILKPINKKQKEKSKNPL